MVIRRSLLGVVALLSFAQNGWAQIMNESASGDTAWQQEYQNLGDQYPSVVAMYGYDGSWHNIGSGTVISANCVLGAAHVALGNNGQLFQKYAVVTGNNLVSDYWGTYQTTQVSVIPEYTGIITSPDMAVWTFDQTMNVAPAPLYTGSDAALIYSYADLSGFGYYGYPSTGPIGFDGVKRGCRDLILQEGESFYGAGSDQLIMDFGLPGEWDYQHLGGESAPGDSGGGWFVNGQLVGVNAYVLGGYDHGSSGATSVSQHTAWIESQIVPEPSTLVLLGVAAGGFLFYRMRRRRGECG